MEVVLPTGPILSGSMGNVDLSMMSSEDTYNLQRFLSAQKEHYSDAINELRSGKKNGHWMWYIFPQYRGLGHSETSQFYAIGSLDEASAYLCHPLLGARLISCTDAVLRLPIIDPESVFGSIDSLKFRSSMTLFSHIADGHDQFSKALGKFYNGFSDQRTVSLCSGDQPS